MIDLLRLEYKKFRDNAVVSLFGLMFFLTLPATIFMAKEMTKNSPPPLPNSETIMSFPEIWGYLAYGGHWIVFFFLGFVMMYIVTSEVGFKTMRQNIITGMTRKDYFLAKLNVAIVMSLVATVYYAICAIVIGSVNSNMVSFSIIFENWIMIPKFFLMCMGFLSFALMVGFLVRRSGIAIFIYVSYIMMIEPLLRWQVHLKIAKNQSINYWPFNAIEDLVPLPYLKRTADVPWEGFDFPFFLNNTQAIIASSIYICIFIGIAFWNFNKRDI